MHFLGKFIFLFPCCMELWIYWEDACELLTSMLKMLASNLLTFLLSLPEYIMSFLFKAPSFFFLIVVPWFLRQDLNVYLWLSWNLLSKTGWSQVHGDPPASASQVLGLKFWATYSWSVWPCWCRYGISGGNVSLLGEALGSQKLKSDTVACESRCGTLAPSPASCLSACCHAFCYDDNGLSSEL